MTKRAATICALALAIPVVASWTGCGPNHETSNPVQVTPDTLLAPDTGKGFQFRTSTFEVPPGTEEQDCYFFKVSDLALSGGLPADQPVNLHRVRIVQLEGSHHMNLFRVRTIVGLDPAKGTQRGTNGQGECFKSPNWADWPLVANTQQKGEMDWTYPDGVANVFQPDEWLMLQTHYVNATTQKVPSGEGAVTVNFYTVAKDAVKSELGTIFATKQSIRICTHNPTPTFEGSCQVHSPTPVNIIGANGHFHSRGTKFEIYSWDGTSTSTPPDSQKFYTSNTWNDPPMLHSPDLATTVPANGGVWYTCSYQWQPPDPSVGCDALNSYDSTKWKTPPDQQDCCYTFGPIVDKNEHCNAFIYYYPKQDNVNCF
jgi:hypothetical protein